MVRAEEEHFCLSKLGQKTKATAQYVVRWLDSSWIQRNFRCFYCKAGAIFLTWGTGAFSLHVASQHVSSDPFLCECQGLNETLNRLQKNSHFSPLHETC